MLPGWLLAVEGWTGTPVGFFFFRSESRVELHFVLSLSKMKALSTVCLFGGLPGLARGRFFSQSFSARLVFPLIFSLSLPFHLRVDYLISNLFKMSPEE